MSFNASKGKTMHYGYGNPARVYKINGNEIESSSQKMDFEILIQEDLDLDGYVVKPSNQSNCILEMIRKGYEGKSVKNKQFSRSTIPLYEYNWNMRYKPGDLKNKNTFIDC